MPNESGLKMAKSEYIIMDANICCENIRQILVGPSSADDVMDNDHHPVNCDNKTGFIASTSLIEKFLEGTTFAGWVSQEGIGVGSQAE